MLAAVLTTMTLAIAGCGSSHPRTEVLRGVGPDVSDIYLRITGPGGAVYYLAQRFRRTELFDAFRFRRTAVSEGVFIPPRVRERKLCASTHVIRAYDAPQLQKWRGKTLEITIYGQKASRIFCAVLGRDLYLEPS
jgi:hypothetical protein